MFEFSSSLAIWLADVHVLECALLAAALGVMLALRQPARRMALAKATLAALAALGVLCALPGWSVVHVLAEDAPAPPSVAASQLADRPEMEFSAQDKAIPFPAPLSAPANVHAAAVESETAAIDWPTMLLAAHGCGSALVAAWLACGGILARRTRRASRAAPEELVQRLQTVVGDGRLPELLVSDAVSTPVALGWRRPAIILPHSLTGGKIGSILDHECAHIAHGDLRTLAASRWLLVLLWPQPLFWLLRRTIRLDQETLADAAAAERAGRIDYAEQLMGWARGGGPRGRAPRLAGAVGLWEGPSQLKRRIAALVDEKLTVLRTCSRCWRVGTALSAIGAALVLSLVTLQPGATPIALAQTAASDRAATEQPTSAAQGAAEAHSASESQVAPPRTVPAWAHREPNVVNGIVVDEVGQGIAGAEVALFLADGWTESTKPTQLATQKTDEGGGFRFENAIDVAKEFPEGLPDDQFAQPPMKVLVVLAQVPGRAPKWGNTLASYAAEHGHVEQLALPPAQTLRGRVTDEAGGPIEGAEVRVGFGQFPGTTINVGRTNAQGNYEVADLAPYDAAETKAQLEALRAQEMEDGSLYLSTSAGETPLLVRHPDFAMKRVAVGNIPGVQNVQLAPGATIEGVAMLHDRDSAPTPAADVTIQITRELPHPKPGERLDQFAYQTTQAQTDAEGRYRFPSLPAGKYTIYAKAPGWTTQGLQGVAGEASQTTRAPELKLTRGGTVRLRLVDASNGQPLPLADGTRGWVNPQLRPVQPMGIMSLDPNVMTFQESAAEFPLAAGKYAFFVHIPRASKTRDSSPQGTYWQSRGRGYSLAVHAVVEGETLEIDVPMKLYEMPQQATATISLVGPPVDGDAEAEDQDAAGIPADSFVPATLPADGQP